MPCEFLSALTDKQTVLVEEFGCYAILVDIELKELNGPVLKFYEPKTISLTQDGHTFLLWIEVVEIEGCDFKGPGARVEKEMKEGIIPEALAVSEVHTVKYLKNLIMIEEPNEVFLIASLGYVQDGLCQFTIIRIHEADHFGEGFDGRKAVISSPGKVFAFHLKVIEE
jgi:hypothetical protein